MTQKDREREDVLKFIEKIAPGFLELLKDSDDGEKSEEGLDILVKLFNEVSKFREEYPIIATVVVDALEALRVHDQRLDILRDILLTNGMCIDKDDTLPPDTYLN